MKPIDTLSKQELIREVRDNQFGMIISNLNKFNKEQLKAALIVLRAQHVLGVFAHPRKE